MNRDKAKMSSENLTHFDKPMSLYEKISDRPCKKCKEKFFIKNVFSKYCQPCLVKEKKEKLDATNINKQVSLKTCLKCKKRFMMGKIFSNFCETCDIQCANQKPVIIKKKSFSTMNEYKNKANTGVRWGCEFVYCKNKGNEFNPILLMGGQFYIIKKDGQLNCLGNRIPSGYYMFKKYDYKNKISDPQKLALENILNGF